jgi:hypothetical protein
MAISGGDNLFRSVHHPVSFRRSVFITEKFWKFDAGQDHLETSIVWERFAPSRRYIHAYGCRQSAERNKRSQKASKSLRHVYCGAYQFKADHVYGLAKVPKLPEVSGASVCHVIETGEIAHANLRIELKNVHGGKIEELKTAIIDHLWRKNRGPLPHKCAVDHDLKPHPSSSMHDPPSGRYIDDRALPLRAWYMIRFWTLRSLWYSRLIPLAGVYRER